MRRVVAISESRSGKRRASAVSCLLDLVLDLFDLLTAFLGDFFADFLDLLEVLERADALAMNALHVKGSSII
jgi:hypothetical protein